MFYIVGVAIVLIIIGIFTLDLIKISIGVTAIVIAFLIYYFKLNRATKDPILFEMLKSVTDLNEELQKEIRNGKNYSSSNNKYMGIILLIYFGFVRAASVRSPINENKFKDLFYAAFNAINFTLKKDLIDTLYKSQQNLEKNEAAVQVMLVGVETYTKKLNGQEYLNYFIEALDELYDNPKIPASIDEYLIETTQEQDINDLEKEEETIPTSMPKFQPRTIIPSYKVGQDAESIYNMGVRFSKGINVNKDDQEAAKLWEKAAAMGHPSANYNLGNWYFHGRVVGQNYEKAVEHYKKAADKGLLEAINNLANCYMHGMGVLKDEEEAVKLYKNAAEKGFAESQYNLGACYLHGDGIESNLVEAIKWYKKAADQGHAEAESNLGICYADGIGVEKNLNEAYKWFKKAADQGEERAINGLKMVKNELEANNIIINEEEYEILHKEDDKEAFNWNMKEAKQGDSKAQFVVGNCYFIGRCVEQNDNEAFKWFMKSAEQGYAEAQCRVASLYLIGRCVEQNDNEAFKWFMKSAEQGYAEAQCRVGGCYCLGKGIKADNNEAFKWFMKSAEQGYAEALNNVGTFYLFGNAVKKDEKEALRWYKKAIEQGGTNLLYMINKRN